MSRRFLTSHPALLASGLFSVLVFLYMECLFSSSLLGQLLFIFRVQLDCRIFPDLTPGR